MKNPYFFKYQMIDVKANSEVTKELYCPQGFHLITGEMRLQDEDVDMRYGFEGIEKNDREGWKFNLRNPENIHGKIKSQIDCSVDLSQFREGAVPMRVQPP